MPAPKVSDAEFIELWKTIGSAAKISKIIDVDVSNIHQRRRTIENRYKIQLVAADKSRSKYYRHLQTAHNHAARHQLGIENGVVIVFSDAHFWPGIRTTAFKGLLWAIREFKPKAIINNGDAFDGASISRFPRIGWDTKPSIIQELKACEASLGEIEEEAGRAKLIWTMGNHDSRFENRLAANAGEFEGVKGFSLKDHFPAWLSCWACWPTEEVCVKHRYKGGIHATHNNTVGAGKTIVTGHLHSLKVTPYADYNGNRFGVDTGTLADPNGPQFVDYLEDNPTNWRSGFAILTFFNGQLLWPELVHDFGDGCVEFRGEVIDVSGL
jgi:hypothetical protein